MDICKIKELHSVSKGRLKQITSDLEDKKNKLQNLNDRMKLLEQAQVFLQKVAQDTQSKLKLLLI